jgi:hypothetical protein
MELYQERISGGAPNNVICGAVSVVVMATNPARRYAIFTNDSDVPIYLSLSDTAIKNRGIRLNPSGGAYEINYSNYYVGTVSAVTAGGANKNLCFVEA